MYKLADGTMSTDYQVGDKFVVVEDSSFFREGQVITLFRDDESVCPWFDEEESPCHWFRLKAYKPKGFTKSDLKDGMVVTYRNKMERVFMKGAFYGQEGYLYRRVSLIEKYCENLDREGNRNLDVMKVEYMDKVLWEREEETPEQKEIKRLQGIIKEAQTALNVINTGNK